MTRKTNLIHFESQERLLGKARRYLDCLEAFLQEKETAVPLLLKALRFADRKLKHRIVLLLGGFAKQDIAWPLYHIMVDPEEDEDVRHNAAIQLSVTIPHLGDPLPLTERLLDDLRNPAPELRANAAFALGWEGNFRAAIPLIELLYDSDIQVQQTAVNALSNLRDDRILNLLIERLEHGPREQKRCILYNLWRFYTKRDAVRNVYLDYLERDDDDLRFDALVLLGAVARPNEYLEVYRKCLRDRDPRIRELALKSLVEFNESDLMQLKDEIHFLLGDPEMKIKEAALELLRKSIDSS